MKEQDEVGSVVHEESAGGYFLPVLPVPPGPGVVDAEAHRAVLAEWRDTLLRRWDELEKSFQRRLAHQREVIDNLDQARLRAQEERNTAETAVVRVRETLNDYVGTLGPQAMVNCRQVLDILEPTGMWSTSFSSEGKSHD